MPPSAGALNVILEASGQSSSVFEGMQALAKNGVLVLTSVTGGDKQLTVPADRSTSSSCWATR